MSNGNMTIKIGIRGAGKAKVSAKGDIATGYIDQSHVRSEGNILVAEAILHSDVAAAGEIIALGSKKGQIVGGTIRAGRELVCEVLGSEMGTKTEVVVGELPELAEERKRNQENIKQFEEQLEKINANYNFLKKQQAEGQLSEEKQALMAKVTKAKFQLQAQHDSTKKRLDVLEAEYEQNRQEGRVRVKKICYPGVAITIRGVRYLVREEYKFASFIYDDGEVKLSSFDG